MDSACRTTTYRTLTMRFGVRAGIVPLNRSESFGKKRLSGHGEQVLQGPATCCLFPTYRKFQLAYFKTSGARQTACASG